MLTINALSAADSVLIPVQPQYYAADGLMELLKVVKGIHQRFNPDLQIEGIYSQWIIAVTIMQQQVAFQNMDLSI